MCASAVVSVGWYGPGRDDELGVAQRRAHPLGVRERHRGVGADDPDGLHAAVLQRVEQVGGGQAGRAARSTRRAVPSAASTSRAMVLADDLAVAGQQVREAAGLAAAHRVRLAGQRQRAGARAADLAGDDAQVQQRAVDRDALDGLVGAHRPQRHRVAGRRTARAARSIATSGTPHSSSGGVRRPVTRQLVAGDQRVEQREVGPGRDLQVDVGGGRGVGAPRVDDDQRRAPLLRGADAAPQDRVVGRRVRAQQQDAVGQLEVRVGGRRAVGAERRVVGGDGADDMHSRELESTLLVPRKPLASLLTA